MSVDPVITIRKGFSRPDEALIADLAGYPSGYFVDIQGRRGAMDSGIKPMFGSAPFIGTAVTVKSVPDDNLAAWVALDVVQKGDVVVIGTGDWTGSAVVGDLIVGFFKNIGVSAIVTDGAVRDVAGLSDIGVPIYARALTPNSPQKNGPGIVGGNISIGGVSVRSGDIVVGDRDGIAVLSHAHFDDAVQAIEGVREKEEKVEAAIAGGATKPDWVDAFLAGDAVRVID
jgi:4-hydroxy-4-methyl-2-oxoglutarate aldolase